MPPGVGAEVIAAENELLEGKAGVAGDLFDEVTEAGGLHAGVAAVLIDLIAGGFDEAEAVVGDGLFCGGPENERVSAADRVDADCRTGVLREEMGLESAAHTHS